MFRNAASNVKSVVKTISGGGGSGSRPGIRPGAGSWSRPGAGSGVKPGAEPAIEYGKPRPAPSQKQGSLPERKSSWTLIRSTRA